MQNAVNILRTVVNYDFSLALNIDSRAVMECFALDYQSEQPVHPDRAFRGREQVRQNWSSIPDYGNLGQQIDRARDYAKKLRRMRLQIGGG